MRLVGCYFRRSRETHIKIDSEEKEALKDVGIDPSSPVVHPLDYQDLVKPIEPVDLPRDGIQPLSIFSCMQGTKESMFTDVLAQFTSYLSTLLLIRDQLV